MKAGVDFWNTAACYGMGVSEDIPRHLSGFTPPPWGIGSFPTKFVPQIAGNGAEPKNTVRLCSQVAIAWIIAKGTQPIIGVTNLYHAIGSEEAAAITLTAEEKERMA